MSARKKLAPMLVEARNTLLELTSALGRALTPRQVAAAILEHSTALSGAGIAALVRRDGNASDLELLAFKGPKELCVRLGRTTLLAPRALAEVVQNPVEDAPALLIDTARALLKRDPSLDELLSTTSLRTLITLPLSVEGQTRGALLLGLTRARKLDPAEADELAVVAQLCSQSLERARLFEAERMARQAAEHGALRISRLQELTAACSEALSPNDVAAAVLTHGRAALHAMSGVVALVDARAQRLEVVGAQGLTPDALAGLRQLSLHTSHPLVEAVRLRQPVWLGLASEAHARFGALSSLTEQAWAALPLLQAGKAIGAVLLGFETPRAFTGAERTLAETVAHHAAQTIERIRLTTERARLAEEAAGRGEFLASASASFASSLDVDTTLERLVKISVPALGDFCFVDSLVAEGRVQRVSSHLHTAKQSLLESQAHCEGDAVGSAFGVRDVFASQSSWYAREVDLGLQRRWARSEQEASLLEVLEPRSVVAAPIRIRGRVLAVLVCAHADSGRRHRREDVALIEDLAHRVGLALDNGLLYAEAQKAVRVREEFLSLAAHELRTPLTALTLTLAALQRPGSAKPASETHEESDLSMPLVARAERHLNRLSRLVEDLLEVSSLEEGPLQLKRERVDLSALVREVAARRRSDLSEARCELTVDAPLPLIGSIDPLRMEQVLTHLLANAMKYAAGTQIHLSVHPLGRQEEPLGARIVVRDHGMGIAPEDQLRVFGRFERAVSSDHYGGLGMGLWLVRRVLEAHGGHVTLESRPGAGTTISAELPLQRRVEPPRLDADGPLPSRSL